MKRIWIAVLSVALLLGLSASAAEAAWYMSFGQAKSESKAYIKEVCAEQSECIAWGVGSCLRRASSRFDCAVAIWVPGVEPGEEIECQQVLHWGVTRSYVDLKGWSQVRCY